MIQEAIPATANGTGEVYPGLDAGYLGTAMIMMGTMLVKLVAHVEAVRVLVPPRRHRVQLPIDLR